MHGINITPDGFMVDIEITDRSVADSVRTALLGAAGSYPRAVATTTHHARPGYRVTRDLAERAGILNPPVVLAEPIPPAESAPKKTAAKKAPAKAAAKPSDVPDVIVPEVEIGGTGDQGGGTDAV